MAAQENSPNYGWMKLGYTIERDGPTGAIRTIKDQFGRVVLEHAGYEAEREWLVTNGVIE